MSETTKLDQIPMDYEGLVLAWNDIKAAQREVYSDVFWVLSHGRFVSMDTFDEVYTGKTVADAEAFKVWRAMQ